MAAPAFRSTVQSASTTAANVTATEPAGAALDDILFADLYIESDTAVTPPAGWSNTFNGTTMLAECDVGTSDFRAYGYWIRRGGSAPALTWTFSSAFRFIRLTAYSGAINTGDPWSFGAVAVRDNQASRTYPDVSGTTNSADELLVWVGNCFAGPSSGTQPTGFTERVDAATFVELADLAQAVAGSTGNVTGASYAGSTADPTSSMLAGLKSVAGGGGGVTLRQREFPRGMTRGATRGCFRRDESGLFVPDRRLVLPRAA